MYMEKDVEHFRTRALSMKELAVLYSPTLTPQGAFKRLNEWIALYPGLHDKLRTTGWRKGQRVLAPVMVELIVDALGEP